MLIKDGTRKGRMKKDSLYVVLKVHKTKYSTLAQSVEHLLLTEVSLVQVQQGELRKPYITCVV